MRAERVFDSPDEGRSLSTCCFRSGGMNQTRSRPAVLRGPGAARLGRSLLPYSDSTADANEGTPLRAGPRHHRPGDRALVRATAKQTNNQTTNKHIQSRSKSAKAPWPLLLKSRRNSSCSPWLRDVDTVGRGVGTPVSTGLSMPEEAWP
jgi:hypothetical protein